MKPAKQSQPDRHAFAPYPPNFIDRFMGFIQRLPVPYFLTYVFLFMLQGAINHIIMWVDGSIPRFTFSSVAMLFPAWQWIPLMIMTFLNNTAITTLENFSRLLDSDEDSLRRLKYEFTTMRPSGVLLTSVFWALFYLVITYSFYDLYAALGYQAGYRTAAIIEGLFCFSLGGVLYYHSLRQLWLVNRTVKTVKRYNLYDLDPVYAFSRLTAWTGLSWILMLLLNLWGFPIEAAPELILTIALIQVGLTIAAFVLPLRFVNRYLVLEKRKLLAENHRRVEATLYRMHRNLDQSELADMDQLNKALASLNMEREIVDKISTLPWRTATLTGFLSATVLPVILLVIQIAIEQWLGQ
jgi:hypothetical protein